MIHVPDSLFDKQGESRDIQFQLIEGDRPLYRFQQIYSQSQFLRELSLLKFVEEFESLHHLSLQEGSFQKLA